jgi:hypothetical protein
VALAQHLGHSTAMPYPISPPSTPSPVPQASLGSQGTEGRKEALCLGRGWPQEGIQGAAPSPRNAVRL